MIYANSPEFDAMTNSALSRIRDLTDEQLQRFSELLVGKNTASSSVAGYGYSKILGDSSKLQAGEIAKYGLASLDYNESKRKYDTTLDETKRQFDIGTAQKEHELSLFEKQMADLKKARRKEQQNWWKQYLGTALGTGLGVGLGALLSPAKQSFSSYSPSTSGKLSLRDNSFITQNSDILNLSN